MKLIELTFNHYRFYCPVTGECISTDGEPINEDASSLRGHWASEEMESPVLIHPDFAGAYQAYLKECAKDSEDDEDGYVPGWEELENFLREYNEPNWMVFNITVLRQFHWDFPLAAGQSCDSIFPA